MKQIFLLLVIAVGLMTSCLGKLEENAKVTDIVSVGQRLPDFTVTTSDSSLVSSGNLRGHASVIVFFSTQCKDCQRALPALQNVYNKYKARVTFVCISRAQSGNDVAAYWQAQGLNMPYSAQTDRSVYALFATAGIPRVYVSDNNGIVRAIYVEKVNSDTLCRTLDGMIADDSI